MELRQSFRLRFEAGDGAKPRRQHLFVRWFAVDGIRTNIEYGGEPLRAQKFGDWIRQPAVFRESDDFRLTMDQNSRLVQIANPYRN